MRENAFYCPRLRLWSSRSVCRELLVRPRIADLPAETFWGGLVVPPPILPTACETCPWSPRRREKGGEGHASGRIQRRRALA